MEVVGLYYEPWSNMQPMFSQSGTNYRVGCGRSRIGDEHVRKCLRSTAVSGFGMNPLWTIAMMAGEGIRCGAGPVCGAVFLR